MFIDSSISIASKLSCYITCYIHNIGLIEMLVFIFEHYSRYIYQLNRQMGKKPSWRSQWSCLPWFMGLGWVRDGQGFERQFLIDWNILKQSQAYSKHEPSGATWKHGKHIGHQFCMAGCNVYHLAKAPRAVSLLQKCNIKSQDNPIQLSATQLGKILSQYVLLCFRERKIGGSR